MWESRIRSMSGPLTGTLHNLLAELLFLVLAALRWFGNFTLQRGRLPPGLRAMVPLTWKLRFCHWPLWAPYASEPTSKKRVNPLA